MNTLSLSSSVGGGWVWRKGSGSCRGRDMVGVLRKWSQVRLFNSICSVCHTHAVACAFICEIRLTKSEI